MEELGSGSAWRDSLAINAEHVPLPRIVDQARALSPEGDGIVHDADCREHGCTRVYGVPAPHESARTCGCRKRLPREGYPLLAEEKWFVCRMPPRDVENRTGIPTSPHVRWHRESSLSRLRSSWTAGVITSNGVARDGREAWCGRLSGHLYRKQETLCSELTSVMGGSDASQISIRS
jgi:hypothetical protein